MSESLAFSTTEAAPSKSGSLVLPRPNTLGGPEQREGISFAAKLNVLLVCTAALGASAVTTLVDGRLPRDWTTFVVLAAVAATAQLFGVHTTHNQSYHLAIVFVLAGALTLPPELVALLCVIQHVPEWIKERLPLEIQGFNIANYTLAALGAWTSAHLVLGSHRAGEDLRTALAGAAAGIAFVLLNHGLLAGMLRIARGHSLRQSGLFTAESLSTDFVLTMIGVGLAAWWHANVWFIPVAVAPLLLVHRALSIPRLRAEAMLDQKTGLYNAGHLNSTLAEEMQRAARFNRPLSVIVADLDLLRKINNSYGHLSGDAVLQGVAEVFRAELRPYDVAARFGGEEFAVLLPETRFDEAMAIAERIRASVAASPFRRSGSDEPVPATLSLGVASYPAHAGDADELVHQADLALYRSKALGRNRVCGATAQTVALHKLLVDGSPRPTTEPVPEAPEPRGFRPYGPDRAPLKRESSLSRGVGRVRELAVGMRHAVEPAEDSSPKQEAAALGRPVKTLIASLAFSAGALLAVNGAGVVHALATEPLGFCGIALIVVALQIFSADVYGSGAEGSAAIGLLAGGFLFGPGAAIALAVLAAFAQWMRKRGALYKAAFDMANFALSVAAAAYIYRLIDGMTESVLILLAGAFAATVACKAINTGLLCLIMSISESAPFRTIWNERFRWASLHYLAFGPLAFASALAYQKMGLVGLMAFALPPVLLAISVRQYLGHTRSSVEEVRRTNEELRRSNEELAESTQRVRATHLATIAALSRSMEAKDHYTGSHTERVASVAVALASRLGYRGDELEAIEIGALVHDVGKIGIPESVLNKTGALTEDEWKIMREHPVISDYILSEVDLHPFVRQIARWSHERIDGNGYPDGLAGNEIPLPARIALVADAFDALTTDRSYRSGRSTQEALDELRAHSGTQFCPLVVGCLEDIWREQPQALGDRHLHAVAKVA